MSTEADTCWEYVVLKLQAAGWENVAKIIGKFGGADQLSNAVNQLQSLLYRQCDCKLAEPFIKSQYDPTV
jgi:hypothetical protein